MTHISALSGLRKGLWGVAISEKKRTKRDGRQNRQKHKQSSQWDVGRRERPPRPAACG